MTHQEYMTIAAAVWNATKAEADPQFAACAQDHQLRLAYKVESVDKSGKCEDEFDRYVKQWLDRPEDVQGYFQTLKDIRSGGQTPPGASFNAPTAIRGLEHVAHPVHGDALQLAEREPDKEIQDEPEKFADPKKTKVTKKEK